MLGCLDKKQSCSIDYEPASNEVNCSDHHIGAAGDISSNHRARLSSEEW